MAETFPRFHPGDQVLYLPLVADGDPEHESVERGFVTATNGRTVFCRFWSKTDPGSIRNRHCSEGCDAEDLRLQESVPPGEVIAWMRQLYGKEEK